MPYSKLNSKWNQVLAIRFKGIEIVEEMGEKFHDIRNGIDHLDMTPNHRKIKGKISANNL